MSMRILALEPYFDGSHQRFLEDWISRSCHNWTLLSLPGYFWKWRMRHAGLTFARQVREQCAGQRFDAVFCSDMLNLPEFLGLARMEPAPPAVIYFHENQLTYPDERKQSRDLHFAMTNFLSALAARGVWFNSRWHATQFLRAMREWMGRAPDFSPAGELDRIENRLSIRPPGIRMGPIRGPREPGPLRIGWVARWEHDKNPESFFEALERLSQVGEGFRLIVLGQSFQQVPEVFERGRKRYADHIEQWGYVESDDDYRRCLGRMDVVVSTARHEFFGIAIAEAVAAGALPLVPDRLAYPELLSRLSGEDSRHCIYRNGRELPPRLIELARTVNQGQPLPVSPARLRQAMEDFDIDRCAPRMDRAMEELAL